MMFTRIQHGRSSDRPLVRRLSRAELDVVTGGGVMTDPRNPKSIQKPEMHQSIAGQMDYLKVEIRNSSLRQSQFQDFAPAFILLFALLVVVAFAIVFFSSPARQVEEPRQPDRDVERQPLLLDQPNTT